MKTHDKFFNIIEKSSKPSNLVDLLPGGYKRLLGHIIEAYDFKIVRAYCKVRFTIININILHILALCLRGKHKVLDLGCGFGLFGCYFSMLYPEMLYCGYDINPVRVEMAKQAAKYLGLHNTEFHCRDARQLNLNDQFDAIMMIDLLHHIDDSSKYRLLTTCTRHLNYDGRLVIKEVTTHPFPKMVFTWILDVLMTKGFHMWYWDEKRFFNVLKNDFGRVDILPIVDWMPYPHVIYLCDNFSQSSKIDIGK